MVQGADGCTMVTGASDSIDLMTPQPLRFSCAAAQCYPCSASRWACRQRVIQQTAAYLFSKCSGALLAALCPAHSSHTGECAGCNSLELRARRCRAKVRRNFRTALFTFVEFVHFLTVLRVQQAGSKTLSLAPILCKIG